MPKSSLIDFKAVKAAIRIEQVLEHYGLLHQFKQSEDRLCGPCPIHKDSAATEFRINIRRNTWNCLGDCKHSGNVLDLIAILENISIQAAAIKAIQWFKLDCRSTGLL